MHKIRSLLSTIRAKTTAAIRHKITPLLARRVKVPAYTGAQRREMLRALSTHPGFQLLILEMQNQRLSFEKQLASKVADPTLKGDLEDFREIVRLRESARAWGWFQWRVQRIIAVEQFLAANAVEEASQEVAQ